MAFGGLCTCLHILGLLVSHSSFPVRGVGIINTAGGSLLRGLSQPQNPPARRSHRPRRRPSHVHGGSYLLGHDTRSLPTGSKLDGDLDRRLGTSVRLIVVILQVIFAWLMSVTDRPPCLCRSDTAPEQHLGRQFGIASMGLTIGSMLGPPIAGVLYERWGFRAPFVFGIIVTGVDLLARLLLIERHEAMRWGVDPMAISAGSKEEDPEVAPEVTAVERAEEPSAPAPQSSVQEGEKTEKQPQESKEPRVTMLPHIALLKLMKSPRAAVSIILTFFWGVGWAGQESALVLHMEDVWGLDPRQAGTAFIAAVVPTIFCEFKNFFSPPRHCSES